jgi:hypothetical protein
MVKTSPFELAKIINEKELHGELTLKPKFSTLQDQNERNCKITNTQKTKRKFNTIKRVKNQKFKNHLK